VKFKINTTIFSIPPPFLAEIQIFEVSIAGRYQAKPDGSYIINYIFV